MKDMKSKILFNWDYFYPLLKEGDLIDKCVSGIEKVECNNGRMLIIIPALMGDFVASIPSLSDYIKRNADKKIDLMVAPPLKKITERIVGVHAVYTAKSVAQRSNEESNETTPHFEPYEEIIILRTSEDVLKNKVPYLQAGKISSRKWKVFKFGLYELLIKTILRQKPKRWHDFHFELLDGNVQDISYKNIFHIKEGEAENIRALFDGATGKKDIIVHTGASWHMMKWEKGKWVELLKKIHESGSYNFIFVGAAKDIEEYGYIASQLEFKTTSLISKLDVFDLMLALSQATYFIGIDSGPGNLAHLVGLRSIIIYGPGPHTFMSRDENDIILDKSNGRGLYQRFFVKKNGFIHKITPQEVFDAFRELELKKGISGDM